MGAIALMVRPCCSCPFAYDRAKQVAPGSPLSTATHMISGDRMIFLYNFPRTTYARSRPVHRGRLRRRARVGAGCGVLRAWLVTAPREASGKTALPPLRAERANAPMRDPRAPLMCNARTVRQGGSEPTIAAVERREASVLRHWTQGVSQHACGRTSLARRRVPLHPSACRRSASSWSRRQTTGRERKPRRARASRERMRVPGGGDAARRMG